MLHCRNSSKKEKKYHTVETVPKNIRLWEQIKKIRSEQLEKKTLSEKNIKCNGNIVETEANN
jgi:hypothetical protein